MIIASTTETPRQWPQKRLREMFPGATILGTPYGWFYHVEQTNVVFVDYGWGELVKQVSAHLKGNDLRVPPDLSLEMQAWFCEVTGSVFCAEPDYNHGERQHFMQQAARFLRAVEDVVFGNGLVSQEEAERRAAICATCPYNQEEKFAVCAGCSAKSAAAKVAKFALGRSTSHDANLRVCSQCSCKLNLKVFVAREAMDYPELRDKWAPNCWMREGN